MCHYTSNTYTYESVTRFTNAMLSLCYASGDSRDPPDAPLRMGIIERAIRLWGTNQALETLCEFSLPAMMDS